MNLLYFLLIKMYVAGIYLASLLGNAKARLWIAGRKSVFDILQKKLRPGENRIWVHASSLGEFEQGRPVIEAIRSNDPEVKIVLTFFSPSGYEIRKNYQQADYISYLPMDGPGNARHFIDIVQPRKVIFIKYDYWYYYLTVLHQRNIPVYLCSGIFRKDQLFFKWYGGWYRKLLSDFTMLFVQNKESVELLNKIGYSNVLHTGDTRFDRVVAIASQSANLEEIKTFVGTNRCLVVGSSWEPDEDLLATYINESTFDVKYIIAPHEIHSSHIERIEKLILKKTVRYSGWQKQVHMDVKVLIIDNIGMLSSLYKYGQVAYIGGGFGKGIHNILEAATFGKPVIFGPKYQKFQEAKDLIELGGAFTIGDYAGLKNRLDHLFTNPSLLNESGNIASSYIRKNTGATAQILSVMMVKKE